LGQISLQNKEIPYWLAALALYVSSTIPQQIVNILPADSLVASASHDICRYDIDRIIDPV